MVSLEHRFQFAFTSIDQRSVAEEQTVKLYLARDNMSISVSLF